MEYIKNKDWEEYYEETDPALRKEIYARTVEQKLDDGANALRKKLFEMRFVDPKKPDKEVDKGVWQMVVLPINLRFQYRLSKKTVNEVKASLTALGLDEVKDDLTASAVYWEIRNIARRYYQSCDGPQYARKYFGIMQSTPEEKLQRTASDVYAMVEGVPKEFGLEKEMEIFSDALRDEFVSISRTARQIYSETVLDRRSESGLIKWIKGY